MSSGPRSQSQQPQPASLTVTLRVRADSDNLQMPLNLTHTPACTPVAQSHLPFCFGAEFELILRPRHGHLPGVDASSRVLRDFNISLLKQTADLLSDAGMPADAYVPDDDSKPDYSKWNVMLDGSLSKKHMRDGFCKTEPAHCRIVYSL